MARRKQLKNVAQGLLSSFISRNNDVYGYWGIGKLFGLMLRHDVTSIQIDILNCSILPESKEFMLLIENYRNKLLMHLNNIGLEETVVIKADIAVNIIAKSNYVNGLSKLGCEITIQDDLGNSHSCDNEVYCRKHSPNRESKSGRVYPDFRKTVKTFLK